MNDNITASTSSPLSRFTPNDAGYEDARRAWNLSIDHSPDLVVMASKASDVQFAVDFARSRDVPLAVQSTGHGAVHPINGGVLLNLGRMTGVTIDPERRTATIAAGTRWQEVLNGAAKHGLAGLAGTAPTVGAVGYTLGGGVGILLRRFGFAADSVDSADVVTAEGELIRASESENPELLRALKGGSGNFGIVTSLDVRLVPISDVYQSTLILPGESAQETLAAWSEWTKRLSDNVTSMAMLVNVPPVPAMPETLHGKLVAVVRAIAANGDDSEIVRLRGELGEAHIDISRSMTYLEAVDSGMEPEAPSYSAGDGILLNDVSAVTVDRIVEIARELKSVSAIELRHLGGAAGRTPAKPDSISHRDAGYVAAMHAVATSSSERQEVAERIRNAFATFPRDDIHGGRLLNFMAARSTHEMVKAAYSPEDYAQLQATKRKYDPENLFRYNHNIPPADA